MLFLLLSSVTIPVFADEINNSTIQATSDGTNVVIQFSGTSWYLENDNLTFSTDAGNETFKVVVRNNQPSSVYYTGWGNVSGPTMNVSHTQDGNYNATITFPLSVLNGTTINAVSFNGVSFTAEQLGLNAQIEKEPEANEEPVTTAEPIPEPEGTPEMEATQEPTPEPIQTPEPEISTPAEQGESPFVIDGDLDDWSNVSGMPVIQSNCNASEWKIAKDTSGNVYLCFTGEAENKWYDHYLWQNIYITQNGQTPFIQLGSAPTNIERKIVNNANSSSKGMYYVEIKFPADYFSDQNYQFSFCGSDITAANIPLVTEKAVQEDAQQENSVYEGIVIDGKFGDWNAVKKYPIISSNSADSNSFKNEAVVFDGDFVYIYIDEGDGVGTQAGSFNNGRFAITTDLGRTLMIQLGAEDGGSVHGVKGAVAKHYSKKWEIAIPASELPQYDTYFNFGLYLSEPSQTKIMNLDGSKSPIAGTFSGIVIDGQYGDWADYPHTLIEHATAGTQTTQDRPDGEGALYVDGEKLYAHLETIYTPHLNGEDLSKGISIAFNGDYSYKGDPKDGGFYPYFVAVDESGNIDYNTNFWNLADGTYEFYIMDTRSWHSTQNVNDLKGNDHIFGKVKMTISDTKCEEEFYIDLKTLAEYTGWNLHDIKQYDIQFVRIGHQWITSAGVSSGPWLGVGLSIMVVAGVLFLRRKGAKA